MRRATAMLTLALAGCTLQPPAAETKRAALGPDPDGGVDAAPPAGPRFHEEVVCAFLGGGTPPGYTFLGKGCTVQTVAPGEYEVTLDQPVDIDLDHFTDPASPLDMILATPSGGAPFSVDAYWEDAYHRHVTMFWVGESVSLATQGFKKFGSFSYRESIITVQ